MKKSQKGFGVVELLIILVIVGLLGGVGYFVFSKQDKSKEDTKTTTNTETQKNQTSEVAKPTSAATETTTKTIAGYKTYIGDKVALQHPSTWTQYTEANKPEWIFFKSADYAPATELGPSVKAGYLLEVRIAKSTATESYAEDLKNAPDAKEMTGGSYETIKIDGNDAILSNSKTEGTYWYATAYKNGNTYYFRLNALDEKKPEVSELFKTILGTVDLK